MTRRAWFAATVCVSALAVSAATSRPATAGPKEIAVAVDKAVTKWMPSHGVYPNKGIESAAVAVAFGGNIIDSFSHNGYYPATPYPIASLSKAITSVCLMQFIDNGALKFSDQVGDLLAARLKKTPPVDPLFKTMTVEQLLIHRAGLKKDAYDDSKAITDMATGVDATAQSTLDFAPGKKFQYSDSGYLLLGFIAQQLYKDPVASDGVDARYKALCGTLLNRLHTTGELDASALDRAPNGGWIMSAMEYATFLYAFAPGSNILGTKSRDWLTALPGKTLYRLGAWRGPKDGGGYPIWHTGLVHHSAIHPGRGASLFVINATGYAAVVLFSGENMYFDTTKKQNPKKFKTETDNQNAAYDDLLAALKSALASADAQQPPLTGVGQPGTYVGDNPCFGGQSGKKLNQTHADIPERDQGPHRQTVPTVSQLGPCK